jgi:hypothetical protein
VNWEAAGAIGEIIAAIAVVVTLIFLTFQLRANSAAVRAQTKQALTDNVQLRFLTVASDVSLAELLARTRVGAEFEDLSEVDQERFRHWAAAIFSQVANYYNQYRLGTIEQADWNNRRGVFLSQLEQPAIREFWDQTGGFHGEDFVSEISRHLSDRP